jgi:hypothetical protein
MEASPLKIRIGGKALASYTLDEELVAMERKYEALVLETARLAKENMMMQNIQLAQENMLLRIGSWSDHHWMTDGQWWPRMNSPTVPQHAGCESACTAKRPKAHSKTQCSRPQHLAKKVSADDEASIQSSVDTEFNSADSMDCKSSSESEEGAAADGACSTVADTPVHSSTTLMMRNLPNNMGREMLIELIDEEGFRGSYDFVYVPVDFKGMAGLGYSFINFVDTDAAKRFSAHFSGFDRWCFQSDKICQVVWNSALQGRDAHIERYRNSSVMHPDVPDTVRPVLFVDGERTSFPAPTKRIRRPFVKKKSS